MIDLDKVREVMVDTLFSEVNELKGVSLAEVMSFHESVLSFLTAKQLIKRQDTIAEVYKINWKRDFSGLYKIPVSSCFELIKPDGINNYLFLSVYRANINMELDRIVDDLQAYCASDSQVLLCTITDGTLLEFENWIDIQQRNTRLLAIGEYIKLDVDKETSRTVWVQMWEVVTRTEFGEGDITQAMKDAVENMYFENIMSTVKKVIYLKYNISEEDLKPELTLAEIIKMSFANEQGVTNEEVYDPEVMSGMTDSELAVANFINDIQKAFSVPINDEGLHKRATLNDLVKVLAARI